MARRSTLRLQIRFDLRAPSFGPPIERLYAAALEQAAWADAHGFEAVMVSEHHGASDSYLPSPLVVAAALAARTKRIRLRTGALVLPLHDPVRVAEDVAVLDLLSGGRAEIMIAAGYVPSEFAMFGRDLRERARLLEEGIAVLEKAWTGEPFDYQGRRVQVTPRPLQTPRPPILLGGSTVSSAKRAARLADGYIPTIPNLFKIYEEECARLGKKPAPREGGGPLFLHLAKDPEEGWANVGRHVLHDVNAYATWAEQAGVASPFARSADLDAVKRTGAYQVMTPEACLAMCRALRDGSVLMFHPLLGGIDPDVANESLELFAREVWPRLEE